MYIEFESEGVRFAICLRNVMYDYTKKYEKKATGQLFELAFPCKTPADVDKTYAKLILAGATSIHPPEDMPWGQRNTLFADPDGNIHEIFATIS
ncbi:MAG: VOC family protein [Firmicutes bacterium]|nr:VOC family protein [Bacillota bacterium]